MSRQHPSQQDHGPFYASDATLSFTTSREEPATALAQSNPSDVDYDFWDAYYASGGGVGESTYVRGVRRASGGTVAVLSQGDVLLKESLTLSALLKSSRERAADYSSPIDAALRMMHSAKPFFANNLGIGLSGGRDSRLVTALALHAGLDFTSFTAVPPDLEADIAKQLNEASHIPFHWEVRDSRAKASRAAGGGDGGLPPILQRAEDWFAFTGGDNWPTYVRKAQVRNKRISLRTMALSGAFGDFTRGHYYTQKEAVAGNWESAISRFHRGMTSVRRLIPSGVRARGALQVKETFSEMADMGFTGFSALDMSFLVNRMRRQLPHPAPNTLLPMLTPQMLAEVFWGEPLGKLDAAGLREMTTALMPEWQEVPYFHEAAVGTDPNVTNKVTIQPTYWEVNEPDFMESVEHSLRVNNYFSISMDAVEDEIRNLPEGRNRTNTVFEFIFWHAGCTELLRRINAAKSASGL